MFPGTNCQSCHTRGGRASHFTASGTVFTSPTCPTPAVGAIVTITDANRKTVSLPVNEVGNFFTTEPLVLPFRVVVESDDGRREMKRSTAGDCNYCHRPDGGPGPLNLP
jgi:mono/diheme cytochrome c family protein